MVTLRDLALARVAKKHGANYSLRIIMEARKAGIPISLAFALIEQESNFRNVFGHDPTTSVPNNWKGEKVTKDRYLHYKKYRQADGMQGVGPAQLTWWEYQNKADQRGGAWKPKHNISVAFEHLASLIKEKGLRAGIAAYNGSGPAAAKYAEQVLERQAKWHKRLT
jgi:soluble lytic murein transglycosylase-like protein